MNLIQENTEEVEFHTSLKQVAHWMEINLENYDWHFADVEGGWPGLNGPVWVTGEELRLKIKKDDYPFIWAVISAFPKGSDPIVSDEPFADGNSEFWKGNPRKQMAGSLFEIVCWDSSATLWIELPKDLGENVLQNAPGISTLEEVNGES
ncbi:MAG: hypothetical protein SchgKO_10470 [Schleiferiaceae bacterium]